MHPPNDKPGLPSYECEPYRRLKDDWQFIRDFLWGSKAWVNPQKGVFDKGKAKAYLPKEQAEDESSWAFRVQQTPFYGRAKRAVAGFANLLTNFETDDLHPDIESIKDDFDKRGNSLKQFGKLADCQALAYGLAWIGAEYTASNPAKDRQEEKAMDKRGWACLYHPLNVINWKIDYVDGQEKLTMLVVKRQDSTPMMFGVKKRTLYRVWVPGKWTDYEIVQSKTSNENGGWVANEVGTGEISLDVIPIVPYYDGLSLDTADPPLYAVFDLELRLYRLASDYYSCLHACNRAIPVSVGRISPGQDPSDVAPLTLGSYHEIMVPAGGNFFFAEPSGSALSATMQSMENTDNAIDRESLQFIGRQQGNVTATESELSAKSTEGTLMGMAHCKESAFETLFNLLAQYSGGKDGGKLIVNRSLLQPKPTVEAVALLYNARLLSRESAVKMIAMIIPGVNPDEELERLAEEMAKDMRSIIPEEQL